jgi:predicted cytidylate kinase
VSRCGPATRVALTALHAEANAAFIPNINSPRNMTRWRPVSAARSIPRSVGFLSIQRKLDQMRITLNGDLGSGKSSVGRLLAERLGVPHYSAGTLFREIGQISNLDALQTNLAAENNVEIDYAVDRRTREIDRQADGFVIDSRMAWHFVTDATKVFLSVLSRTAAERVNSDPSRSGEKYDSLSAAEASLEKRRESEIKRYKKLYAVDVTDSANYDLVIITDDAVIEDIAGLILAFAERKTREKLWLPKTRLVPMISIRDASGIRFSARTSLTDRFHLPLLIAQNFGFYFDDANRLASAFNYELSLIPYVPVRPLLVNEDVVRLAQRTLTPSDLYDWEDAFAVKLSFEKYLAISAANSTRLT